MNSQGYQLFLEFAQVPHASFHTEPMKEWLKNFAKSKNLVCKEDKVGNLLFSKGNPKLCLQAHYDMVMVGEKVTPYINDEGYLVSKDSSLGADNGAALCAALVLFDVVDDLEVLITNDEEVGMIGANHLELVPQSKRMLNLDSEDVNEIIIGCAGGVDLSFCFENLPLLECEERLNVYKVTTQGFKGGHSGIDINKNIPNAIVAMVEYIQSHDEAYLVSLKGGEKRNSIAVNCEAIVLSRNPLKAQEGFQVVPFMLDPPYRDMSKVMDFIKLPLINGVIMNNEKGAVHLSSNLGIVVEEKQNVILQVMARSNGTKDLKDLIQKLEKYAKGYGVEMQQGHFYPAWEVNTQIKDLLTVTQQTFSKYGLSSHATTIHAGLECGILKNKLQLDEILSIGPTIDFPHSKYERMNMDSFLTFEKILKEIVQTF